MDAKKLMGMLVAVVLVIPIIASAQADTLALIEVGLVGILYVMRRRRARTCTPSIRP